MHSKPSYPVELRALAQRLATASTTAHQRRIFGLADALDAAAESARSWADALEDGIDAGLDVDALLGHAGDEGAQR